MLNTLTIKNYAIIDSLEIHWHKDLTVITGETGAGKSIIIGALQLVLGSRSDSKVLRKPTEKCTIEMMYTCNSNLQKLFKEKFEIETDEELIIRREILPNGKSRSFVNDSPVLLADINRMSAYLLSIHQQFDHLDFFDKNFQLQVLDSFSGLQDIMINFQKKFKTYQDLLFQKNKLEESIRKGQMEKDFLEFQYSELQSANLKKDELNQLESDLKLISKSEEIKSNTLQCIELIEEESGIIQNLQQCMNLLKNIRMHEKLNAVYERFEQSKSELKDLSRELELIADQTEFNPETITQVNQRIDVLNSLVKKHRVQSDNDLILLREEILNKLTGMNNSDETLNETIKQIDVLYKSLFAEAKIISEQRTKHAKDLIKQTGQLLQQLGMEFAKFDIQLNQSEELKESGIDQIEFLFSANKGVPLRPIKDQVSGGELARFNLAIKSQLAMKNEAGCIIFDEIDTGVSGQIALQMGNILKNMAAHQQVICITHSPQVASRAKHHFFVYKEHEDESSNTNIKELDWNARLNELAKMLSGEPPTKAALKNASELISMN